MNADRGLGSASCGPTRPSRGELSARLEAAHGLTLSDYDVLVQLYYAPERRAPAGRPRPARSCSPPRGSRGSSTGSSAPAGSRSARCASDARVTYAVLTDGRARRSSQRRAPRTAPTSRSSSAAQLHRRASASSSTSCSAGCRSPRRPRPARHEPRASPPSTSSATATASARSGGRSASTAFGVNALVYPPGYEGFQHYHDTQDELYFVHRGKVRVEVDGETRDLGPGGLFHARVDDAAQALEPVRRGRGRLRRRRQGRLRRARRAPRRSRADAERRASFGKS